MNKRETLARIRENIAAHAPSLLPILVVSWGEIVSGEQGFAILHAAPQVPIDTGDAAIIVFDSNIWRGLSAAQREELADHETAHLLADFQHHKHVCNKHNSDWQSWYGRLRSGEE